MSERTDIYEVEVAKWDALASVPTSDESLAVAHGDFAGYAAQDSTMLGMAEFLGDLRGREVLEVGSGMGEMTTQLARSGARVTAVDISPASIAVARRRAELHGVDGSIDFVVAAGERLPMEPDRFDIAVGKAVLHHLSAAQAAPELHRVLRPGARAAFAEPLGTNPVIAFARDHLPYPGKNPRGADVPLSYGDLAAWEAPFSVAEHREVQLLESVERALGVRPMRSLRDADDWLLARFPGLRRLCRYVVITVVK
jgi:SAM-dependent methyltransferase